MDDDQNPDEGTTQTDLAGGEHDTVTVQWRDLEWTVPKDRNTWDMNVQFEFEDGRRVRAICTLLGGGPEGLTKVRNQVYAAAKTAGELEEFVQHVSEVVAKECINNLP
jgi:tartrate dehydratase alpha subunit/fumarate hydratase class I-like protein